MSMQRARATTEHHLPGLIGALEERGLMALETGDPGQLCALFRRHRGAGLIIPEHFGGLAASPIETVEILRMIGSLSPSLAVMMTMHHHTVVSMVQLGEWFPVAGELLTGIAGQQMLVASAFAEGKPGSGIFNASVTARPSEGGYRLRGTKKPCSMTHHLDVVVVGVAREQEQGEPIHGFAIVLADDNGLERQPFWGSPILQAADNNALSFNDTFVPEQRMLLAQTEDDAEAAMLSERASLSGLCWFQFMVGATYLGVASALARLLIEKRNVDDLLLAQIAIELEGAHQALIGGVHQFERQPAPDHALYQMALSTRFMVQAAVERATNLAVELAGGMAFASSDQVSYLLAASRAICFHPVSRSIASPLLSAYLRDSLSPRASSRASTSTAACAEQACAAPVTPPEPVAMNA